MPGWVGVDKQKALVEEMRGIAREYAATPMAMVRPRLKSGGQMSVFSCIWAGIGIIPAIGTWTIWTARGFRRCRRACGRLLRERCAPRLR